IQFKLPAPITREKAKELYTGTAPNYQKVDGLIGNIIYFPKTAAPAAGFTFGNQKLTPRSFSRRSGTNLSKTATALNRSLVTSKVRCWLTTWQAKSALTSLPRSFGAPLTRTPSRPKHRHGRTAT